MLTRVGAMLLSPEFVCRHVCKPHLCVDLQHTLSGRFFFLSLSLSCTLAQTSRFAVKLKCEQQFLSLNAKIQMEQMQVTDINEISLNLPSHE